MVIEGRGCVARGSLATAVQDVTITNDGATILKLLEVEHPAAKVLVELADLQDKEIGDGTTSVVIIAAELLRLAEQLVRDKIHPTSIISGCVPATLFDLPFPCVVPRNTLGFLCHPSVLLWRPANMLVSGGVEAP